MGELIYQVYDLKLKKWLPIVTGGFDYAGNLGNPIGAIRLSIRNEDWLYNILGFGTKESLTYKVHTKSTLFYKGRWLEAVNTDRIAGDCKHQIDAIMIKSNKNKLIIKVHNIEDIAWHNYVDDYCVCGTFGKPIDAIKVFRNIKN